MSNEKKETIFSPRLVMANSDKADYAVKELVASFESARIVSRSTICGICIYTIELPIEHQQEFMLKVRYHAMIKDAY